MFSCCQWSGITFFFPHPPVPSQATLVTPSFNQTQSNSHSSSISFLYNLLPPSSSNYTLHFTCSLSTVNAPTAKSSAHNKRYRHTSTHSYVIHQYNRLRHLQKCQDRQGLKLQPCLARSLRYIKSGTASSPHFTHSAILPLTVYTSF